MKSGAALVTRRRSVSPTARSSSRIVSVRSIAAGRSCPSPGLYGPSRAKMTSSVTVTTAATDPMSMACVTAPSARSAKNSMKTKMITALTMRTTQSESGITFAAPWMRSRRASSRSEVWSSHFEYAACSLALSGSTVFNVRKSATPTDSGHRHPRLLRAAATTARRRSA